VRDVLRTTRFVFVFFVVMMMYSTSLSSAVQEPEALNSIRLLS